jgi:hypothetical protein
LKPHANAVVVVKALEQLRGRGLKVSPDRLAPLCQHHRTSIREAARTLNHALGYAEARPFDPRQAMQSEPIRGLMDQLSQLILDPPPPDAPFVVMQTNKPEGHSGWRDAVDRGWLLQQDKEKFLILTPVGRRETHRFEDRWSAAGKDEVTTRTLVEFDIREEVQRVQALRQQGDKDFQLSERGGLTGQFEGGGAGLYEIFLAHWLFATKRDDLAAVILLPALDTLYRDQDLVGLVRHRLGVVYGQRMLAAFAGSRDYDETLKWARQIVSHFPETEFYAYAAGLASQIPRRRDDFKQLRLPTPREWEAQKKTMARAEQIDFLCQRLRLLNCFQHSQPGGASFTDHQYAEPCGISVDASWGGGSGKTPVINPFVELVGTVHDHSIGRTDRVSHPGIGLTVADIPQLANYLREDWFIPTVSFWRDFSSHRQLHSSREVVAEMINGVARQYLCRAQNLAHRTEEEREQVIEKIVQWAHENEGKSEADLLLLSLENDLAKGYSWGYTSSENAKHLVKLGDQRVRPLLVRFQQSSRWHSGDHIQELIDELDGVTPRQRVKRYVIYALPAALALLILLIGLKRLRAARRRSSV